MFADPFSFYDYLITRDLWLQEEKLGARVEEIGIHFFTVVQLYGLQIYLECVKHKDIRDSVLNVCLTKGEFWQIDESLFATVRSVVGQGLTHQMGFQPSSLQAFFHELHRLQTNCGVKMAVHTNNGSSCKWEERFSFRDSPKYTLTQMDLEV